MAPPRLKYISAADNHNTGCDQEQFNMQLLGALYYPQKAKKCFMGMN